MKINELKKGARYKVTFQDCCVQGDFIATFLHYTDSNKNPIDIFDSGGYGDVIFDTASISNVEWAQYYFEEL